VRFLRRVVKRVRVYIKYSVGVLNPCIIPPFNIKKSVLYIRQTGNAVLNKNIYKTNGITQLQACNPGDGAISAHFFYRKIVRICAQAFMSFSNLHGKTINPHRKLRTCARYAQTSRGNYLISGIDL